MLFRPGAKAIVPPEVEDRYGLSPIQQSMLNESLSARAGARVGLLQLVWDLREPVDVAALQEAWRRTAERHPILRTRLVWGGRSEPCQEVLQHAAPPFAECDWTSVPPERRDDLLRGWLVEDRRLGLDLAQAPLLRVMVAHVGLGHHRVVLTIHHILFDGRTLLLLIQEIFAFYAALRRGEVPALPVPRPYRAFIEWLATRDQEAAGAFWRQMLQGIREPTSLGIERPAESRSADRAAPVWFYDDISTWLAEESTAALRSFARGLDVTLNTLLLGAWALLLGRYSGRRDILFGVVRTHRGAMPEGATVLGPVMGSMPLRITVAPEMALGAWLQTLRSRWLAMRAADFASPSAIRGWSELDPHVPLFETLVLFETHELTERLRREGPDWRQRSFQFIRQPRVPLSVYGYLERRLALKIIWDPARFDRLPIERLLGQLQRVLEAMPAGTRQQVGELPLVSAGERHLQLVEWNDTARTAASPVSVQARFEEQARRSPERLAVADVHGNHSYGQIDAGANRLARLLAAMGVGPGVIVAVHLERSAEEAQALLAVLKAGGAYLPLEPSSARERVTAILEEAQPAVLLTRSGLRQHLDFPGDRTLCLDHLPALGDPSAGPLCVETLPDQPAYVIYTSGSTGRPKGVVIPHRGLSNLAAWHVSAFAVTAADRASRLAGLGFDASVWELWPYWSAGAAVVLPAEEYRLSVAALRNWLIREAVTHAFVPTPIAERLLAASWPAEAGLRRLLTGGDILHDGQPAGLPFQLLNNYGPTENSVVTTAAAIPAVDPGDWRERAPAIGRPIPNVRVYLLDPDLRPVPIGARGELFVAGSGLAQGYLARAESTASSFLPDPFAASGRRMYRTGDLARFEADGSLGFLGRCDSQVKLRGFRIEPAEIEAALCRHPGVRACAVVARAESGRRDKRLVAFLVGRRYAAVTKAGELRGFLADKVPDYMIPSTFAWLDALPLTESGKVDRSALDRLRIEAEDEPGKRVPPVTALERLLARMWEEVLGCAEVGIDDNFFALGGHSLKAMEVVSMLRDTFRLEVPAELVFLAPTIDLLAAELFPDQRNRLAAERIAALALDPSPADAPCRESAPLAGETQV